MEKQILCMKWGDAYSAHYVNTLYGMAARNITGPFRFYCFTDDAAGIRPEVVTLPLPELGCAIPPEVPGKWRKSALWGRELFGLKGAALFLDLDSVIVGNIDGYFTHGDPEDVVVARNWVNPIKRGAQTSVFRFPIGRHAYLLDNLRADPAGIARRHLYEQGYVTAAIRGGVKYWPEPWTRHFRLHCVGPWPVRFFRAPRLPRDARIVTFPGTHPKPEEAAAGRWSGEQTSPFLSDHLRRVWRNFRAKEHTWRKQFSHFLLRADWVHENWRP